MLVRVLAARPSPLTPPLHFQMALKYLFQREPGEVDGRQVLHPELHLALCWLKKSAAASNLVLDYELLDVHSACMISARYQVPPPRPSHDNRVDWCSHGVFLIGWQSSTESEDFGFDEPMKLLPVQLVPVAAISLSRPVL